METTTIERQKMLDWANEHKDDIVWWWLYKDDIASIIYDFTQKFWLSFDVDYVENSSDSRLQFTVYIKWSEKRRSFNAILDCDFASYYETTEEFVDKMIETEKISKDFIGEHQK